MGHMDLSQATLHHEAVVGHEHLMKFGDLPTGNEPGGHFWDWVRGRYDVAVDTGHLARFEFYHPVITPWLQKDHETRFPVVPVPKPPPYCPSVVPGPLSMISLGVGVVLVLLFSRIWRHG